MGPLGWFLVSSAAMIAIALFGGAVLLVPERHRGRLVPRLVAFAAGALLGGALFHLLPEAIEAAPGLSPWLGAAAGFCAFWAIEHLLRLQHHHGHPHGEPHAHDHGPVVWLVLAADAIHKLLGGVSVAGAFVVDVRLGWTVWLAEAAHELPHALGDVGVMLHAGLPPRRVLAYNALAALAFPIGGVAAWSVSSQIEPALLLAFGAGNFVYIAAVDLLPEVRRRTEAALADLTALLAGLAALYALAVAIG